MHVLIALENQILSDALKQFMAGAGFVEPISSVCAAKIPEKQCCVKFDVVITNYLSLDRMTKDFPDTCKVLVLDNGLEEETIIKLFLTKNISGIISFDSDVILLLKAIRAVHKGELWISSPVLRSLIDKGFRAMHFPSKLSERETALVNLVHRGYRNKQIADMLSISEQTVKSHLNRIFRKMNVSTRTELIVRYPDFLSR